MHIKFVNTLLKKKTKMSVLTTRKKTNLSVFNYTINRNYINN